MTAYKTLEVLRFWKTFQKSKLILSMFSLKAEKFQPFL